METLNSYQECAILYNPRDSTYFIQTDNDRIALGGNALEKLSAGDFMAVFMELVPNAGDRGIDAKDICKFMTLVKGAKSPSKEKVPEF